jgi:hypothetical protein
VGRFDKLTRRQARWAAVWLYLLVLVGLAGGFLGYRLIRPDLLGVAVGLLLTGTIMMVLALPIGIVVQVILDRRQRRGRADVTDD